MTGAALAALERLLLPNCCVACGRQVERGRVDELLCSPCRSRMRAIPPGCTRCRQPLPPVGPCRFCSDWPPSLGWVTSAVWLGDEAREIVHHLKYDGYVKLARVAAEVTARVVAHPGHAVLVPVPLGRRRRRERGYNQAAELAAELGNIWSLPVAPSVLERARETKTQTKLAPKDRMENVWGAFVARPHPRSQPQLTRTDSAGIDSSTRAGQPTVILIDDVLTTGATLAAAATAMAEAGWTNVGAVTFARAMPLGVQLDRA